MAEFKLIEHELPSADMPMPSGCYGFWTEFIGKKKDFERVEAVLLLKCYQHMINATNDRAIGLYEVIQITKKDNLKDALNNDIFKATVGIKWSEKPVGSSE